MEKLDLYDNEFDKLNKTIIRRVVEIPNGANIMQSYILIKNNGMFLLEQTTERNNFKWAIPGGHVLSGETAEEGLKRELKEELNLENINFKLIETVKFPYNKFIFNVFCTEDKIDISKIVYQPEEVSMVKWYTKEEILKLISDDKIPRGYAFILENYMY